MILLTQSGRIGRVSSGAASLGGQQTHHWRPQLGSGGQQETLPLSSVYLRQSLLLLHLPRRHHGSSSLEKFVFLVLSLVELLKVASNDGDGERHHEDA